MRILAHLDLDAFFAAVEELGDPRSGHVRSWSAATLADAESSRRRTMSHAGSASARR